MCAFGRWKWTTRAKRGTRKTVFLGEGKNRNPTSDTQAPKPFGCLLPFLMVPGLHINSPGSSGSLKAHSVTK